MSSVPGSLLVTLNRLLRQARAGAARKTWRPGHLTPLELEFLETRTLPSNGSLTLGEAVSSTLTDATSADTYELSVTQAGYFTADLHAPNFQARLSLRDASDNMLVQSDTRGPQADAVLAQNLDAPTGDAYSIFLSVEGPGGGTGDYTLTTTFVPAAFPLGQLAPNQVGTNPLAMVTGDFNRDGRLDLVSANAGSTNLSVLLGQGDGSFEEQRLISVGGEPTALAAADLNGDGRLDLAVAHQQMNQPTWVISILLGNGDGTFRALPESFAVGQLPDALIAADFNGDGRLDLAVADAGSDDITILLGLGDGTFRAMAPIAVGTTPAALTTGDFNGDGKLDLAVANAGSNDVSLLLGNGDGTFRSAGAANPVEADPVAIVAGDFNGDGNTDLAVTNHGGNLDGTNDGSVSILLGNGDGSFQPETAIAAGSSPVGLVADDFNSDHHLDLAVSDSVFAGVTLLLGAGDGTFTPISPRSLSGQPVSLTAGDFDGDGTPDLAIGTNFSASTSEVAMLLDRNPLAQDEMGDSVPDLEPPLVGTDLQPKPLVADVTGDGIPDTIIVDRAGQILVRPGLAHQPGFFAPAIVINPRSPARAVTTVRAGSHELLAAIDQAGNTVSIYSVDPSGTVGTLSPLHLTAPQTVGIRIVAGKLAKGHDGFDDLAVLQPKPMGGRVSVFLSDGQGGFIDSDEPMRMDVGGNGPSDLTLADVNGDGIDDVLVTNRVSGDVTVLVNNESGFFTEQRFRAGTGAFGITGDGMTLLSSDALGAAAVGDFNQDGQVDLVIPDPGARSLSLLFGQGSGSNPQTYTNYANFGPAVSLPLTFRPGLLAAGQFTDDNHDGHIDAKDFVDLAILNPEDDTLAIYLGDGAGSFQQKINMDRTGQEIPLLAGAQPTGLTIADVNGDGIPDLLVGDAAGDVLTLLGNGDGTFRSTQQIAGQNASLAVDPLGATGQSAFVVGNQALSQVAVQNSLTSTPSIFRDRQDGILAPGAVRIADMNGDGLPDLVVANSGANDVLVYLGTGNGQFGPAHVFFTGTDPAGVTVQDLNGDGVLDLVVADKGSNDVDLLFGHGAGASWTLIQGPRLASGGSGPVSTLVTDVNGDGIPDLLVTNNESNTITLLPGVGNGFFNDTSPVVFPTGAGPVQSIVGNFNGSPDLVSVDSGSNDLTFFPGLNPAAGQTVPTGGLDPMAALVSDVNGDGFADLIIANNENGLISLLLGGADGLSISQALGDASLPHPSDLALAALGDDAVSLYVTNSGEDQVVQFTLELGLAIPPPSPGTTSGGGEERMQIVTLLPLEGSAVPTLATLIIGEQTAEAASEPIEFHTLLVLLGAGGGASGLVLEANFEVTVSVLSTDTASGENADLFNLLLDLDGALQRSRQAARERLAEPPPPVELRIPQSMNSMPDPWLAPFPRQIEGAGQMLADFGHECWQAAGSVCRSVAELFSASAPSPDVRGVDTSWREVFGTHYAPTEDSETLPDRGSQKNDEQGVDLLEADVVRLAFPSIPRTDDVLETSRGSGSLLAATGLAALWNGRASASPHKGADRRRYRPVLQGKELGEVPGKSA